MVMMPFSEQTIILRKNILTSVISVPLLTIFNSLYKLTQKLSKLSNNTNNTKNIHYFYYTVTDINIATYENFFLLSKYPKIFLEDRLGMSKYPKIYLDRCHVTTSMIMNVKNML